MQQWSAMVGATAMLWLTLPPLMAPLLLLIDGALKCTAASL
jgi:hypothetical protein